MSKVKLTMVLRKRNRRYVFTVQEKAVGWEAICSGKFKDKEQCSLIVREKDLYHLHQKLHNEAWFLL